MSFYCSVGRGKLLYAGAVFQSKILATKLFDKKLKLIYGLTYPHESVTTTHLVKT
jgi:hypothetical protein